MKKKEPDIFVKFTFREYSVLCDLLDLYEIYLVMFEDNKCTIKEEKKLVNSCKKKLSEVRP